MTSAGEGPTNTATAHVELYSLPNELLIHILSLLPSRDLLRLALVSRRFCDLIIYILHARLPPATAFDDGSLVLEFYQPGETSRKRRCTFLRRDKSHDAFGNRLETAAFRFGRLMRLYYHFYPRDLPERETVYLGAYKSSSQLCMGAKLVAERSSLCDLGIKTTMCKGVIHVQRQWLADQARLPSSTSRATQAPPPNSTDDSRQVGDRRDILWVGRDQNLGIRASVEDITSLAISTMVRLMDRYPPPADTAWYEIKPTEVVLRASQVLLKVEDYLGSEIFIILGIRSLRVVD